MTVRSYAKINLGLRVLGRRPDGFHDISTVFHRVDLFDTLHLEATDGGITLESDRDDIPTDDGNLCVRAARLLLERQRGMGVHMVLHKRIPAGAGLGGGSSNAATVLRFLPRLLGLRFPEEELLEMAAILGSDVPFFLHDGSAVARGRGEVLEYFSWECPWWIVLVNPGIHVSTAWAYASLRAAAESEDPDLRAALLRAAGTGTAYSGGSDTGVSDAGISDAGVSDTGVSDTGVSNAGISDTGVSDTGSATSGSAASLGPMAIAAHDAAALGVLLHNDFEEAVMRAHPDIRRAKDALLGAGAVGALMSGSGSSVFGLFNTGENARQAAALFPAEQLLSVTCPDFSPDSVVRSA